MCSSLSQHHKADVVGTCLALRSWPVDKMHPCSHAVCIATSYGRLRGMGKKQGILQFDQPDTNHPRGRTVCRCCSFRQVATGARIKCMRRKKYKHEQSRTGWAGLTSCKAARLPHSRDLNEVGVHSELGALVTERLQT